jgi:hypothetical protein
MTFDPHRLVARRLVGRPDLIERGRPRSPTPPPPAHRPAPRPHPQAPEADNSPQAGNSPPSCDGHHSGASQCELVHTQNQLESRFLP